MSAYIVSRSLIDSLVRFAIRRRHDISPYLEYCGVTHAMISDIVGHPNEFNSYGGLQVATVIGRILWQENLRSVAHRYPDDTPSSRPGPICDDIDAAINSYELTVYHANRAVFPDAREVLKLISELDYQSCETDDWKTTPAYRILQRIKDSAISDITEDTDTRHIKRYALDPKEFEDHMRAERLGIPV